MNEAFRLQVLERRADVGRDRIEELERQVEQLQAEFRRLSGVVDPLEALPHVRTMLTVVAEEHGIPLSSILGPARTQEACQPRFMAFYLVRQIGGFSLPQIGRAMSRDHTSVLLGIRRHEQRMKREPALLARTEAVSARIRALLDQPKEALSNG